MACRLIFAEPLSESMLEVPIIRTLWTNFSEILGEIHSFSFKKMHLKVSSAKGRPFSLGLDELSKDKMNCDPQQRCSEKSYHSSVNFVVPTTIVRYKLVNTLSPKPNGSLYPDDIFKSIFLNENIGIFIIFSLKFVSKFPVNNKPALVQIMARRRQDDTQLSGAMITILLTHVCVTRPQWVKTF